MKLTGLKGMSFDTRHWLFFSPFLLPPKKRGKRKGEKNNQCRGQNACLSDRSTKLGCSFCLIVFIIEVDGQSYLYPLKVCTNNCQ